MNKTTIVYMERTQKARREYRLTGAGLYVEAFTSMEMDLVPKSIIDSNRVILDDVKVSKNPGLSPTQKFLTRSSQVLGQDTLMLTTYKSKTYFFFGDTTCLQSARQNNCQSYGMHTVGATFPSSFSGGPPPLKYFSEDDNFLHVKPMAVISPLEQNTWLAGVITVNNKMYGNYVKNPGDGESAGSIATGMMIWDDVKEEFEVVKEWPDDHGFLNGAHTVQRLGPEEINDGHIYFDNNLRGETQLEPSPRYEQCICARERRKRTAFENCNA